MHGLLMAFELPAADDDVARALWASLQEGERALGADFAPRRKVTFAGGRYALRRALEALGCRDVGEILPNVRQAPMVPPGFLGSISHKDSVACAIAERGGLGFIGVDVEVIGLPSSKIQNLVLTEQEIAYLTCLRPDEQVVDLALRWSLKEAVYKAIDPYVRRYVGFQEVEVWPQVDGHAKITLLLKKSPAEYRYVAEARWLRQDALVYSTVRVTQSD